MLQCGEKINRLSERIYESVCVCVCLVNLLKMVLRATCAVVVILKRPPSCPSTLTDHRTVACVCVCVRVWVLRDSASLLRSTESEAAGAADADWLLAGRASLGDRKGENELRGDRRESSNKYNIRPLNRTE